MRPHPNGWGLCFGLKSWFERFKKLEDRSIHSLYVDPRPCMRCGAVHEDRSCGWTKSMPQVIALKRIEWCWIARSWSHMCESCDDKRRAFEHVFSRLTKTGRHRIDDRMCGPVMAQEGQKWPRMKEVVNDGCPG